MSGPKFIADRIFSLSKENLSSTVMRLAVTSVALAIIVMLIAWAVVVGFKNQIRDKVIGFVAPIHVQSLDKNESVEETPFQLDSLLIGRLNSVDGIAHYQMVANKAGMIKTDVVYFGEMLPDGAIETSMKRISDADEFWIIGSTLEVFPAASLAPFAAQCGKPITIMNMGATQYDRLAENLIREPIQNALPELVERTIALHSE